MGELKKKRGNYHYIGSRIYGLAALVATMEDGNEKTEYKGEIQKINEEYKTIWGKIQDPLVENMFKKILEDVKALESILNKKIDILKIDIGTMMSGGRGGFGMDDGYNGWYNTKYTYYDIVKKMWKDHKGTLITVETVSQHSNYGKQTTMSLDKDKIFYIYPTD